MCSSSWSWSAPTWPLKWSLPAKPSSGFTDLTYSAGVLVGAAVIILYTLVGGYKAVAWTDLIQGVLMLLGLIIVPLIAIDAAGGWEAYTESAGAGSRPVDSLGP